MSLGQILDPDPLSVSGNEASAAVKIDWGAMTEFPRQGSQTQFPRLGSQTLFSNLMSIPLHTCTMYVVTIEKSVGRVAKAVSKRCQILFSTPANKYLKFTWTKIAKVSNLLTLYTNNKVRVYISVLV